MFVGKDNLVRKNICSVCNGVLNSAAQVNGNEMPDPGDISLCLECGNIAVFGDNLELRQPTWQESLEFEQDHELMSTQAIIFAIKKVH